MKVRYILAGKDVQPLNRQEIFIEVNHDQQAIINQGKSHVGINNLSFAREDVNYIMSLLNQSPGITEGIPFDVEITEGQQTETINLYLNMMNGFMRSSNGISADVKMLYSQDWLDDRTDGFTFESMYNEKGVAPFYIDGIKYNSYQAFFDRRCLYVPYVISTIPNYQNTFMAMFAVVTIIIDIYRAVKDIIQAAEVWFQLIAEAPFVIALLFTLLAMIEQLINNLIQPVKYHGAMLMVDLLKITAKKLGLTFKSSIWESYPYNAIAFLPEKYNPPFSNLSQWEIMSGINIGGISSTTARGARVGGFIVPGVAPATEHDSSTPLIQKGYFNGTGGDFLRLAKSMMNGKIIIPDKENLLVMERRDYYPSNAEYQMPDIRQDWNGFNTDEMSSTMIVRYQADLSDKNCMDIYPGTILQATTQQVTTNDILKVNLRGLREININAARGKRKESFTDVELIVIDVIDFMNKNKYLTISFINSQIITVNGAIFLANSLIFFINGLLILIFTIVNSINFVIEGLSKIGINLNQINFPNGGKLIPFIKPVKPINKDSLPESSIITDRQGTLMLETDLLNTPKMLFIDTFRAEYGARIAYLHPLNANLINAKYLWDNFYFIDQFTNDYPIHNRYTKISPALNHDSEKNPISLKLKDFKKLVSNPKLKDNFGEEIIADSIQWYIEKNGKALIDFRKKGWLSNPQSLDGSKRVQEININLTLKKSIPNGQ